MSVSVAAKNTCETIGEGPHWDPVSKVLWYVDIGADGVNGDVHRLDTTTGQDTKVHLENTVGFVTPTKSNPESLVIGLGRRIALLDWKTKNVSYLTEEVESTTKNRFNDGKCDPSGRLWAGTMGYEAKPGGTHLEKELGNLYSLTKGGKLKHHLDKISISNGLDWSADQKTMYYIDSVPRKVFAFDFDITNGEVTNQRVAIDYGEGTLAEKGVPDGCCLDAEGKLWVACYNGGKVIRFDPGTGKELSHIAFPAKRITSCCFGGDNLDELYVTCAKFGLTEEEFENEQPLAGSVFKVTGLGVKGNPMHVYADK